MRSMLFSTVVIGLVTSPISAGEKVLPLVGHIWVQTSDVTNQRVIVCFTEDKFILFFQPADPSQESAAVVFLGSVKLEPAKSGWIGRAKTENAGSVVYKDGRLQTDKGLMLPHSSDVTFMFEKQEDDVTAIKCKYLGDEEFNLAPEWEEGKSVRFRRAGVAEKFFDIKKLPK